MTVSATKLVKDLAIEIPAATNIFEKFGIDYCCGGKKSLQDACASVGVATNEVIEMLDKASESPENTKKFNDWTKESLGLLVNYILENHHTYVHTELPRLNALLTKVVNKHGENHIELYQVQANFSRLTEELNVHMYKEEQVLFPYIIRLETAKEQKQYIPLPPFGTVANPISVMCSEHDEAGEILHHMRKITDNYAVPSDACTSFTLLYQGLVAFEEDLHKHVHLENNILFPRAIAMEGK